MAKKINKPTDDTAARKAAVAKAIAGIKPTETRALSSTALTSVTSRFDLGKAFRAFIGNVKPESAAYEARYLEGRRALVIGYLAARFRREGDNRPDAMLLDYAGEVHDCAAPDAKKVADGQRRCTEAEWTARGASRTWLSGLCADAGVSPPNSEAKKRAAKKRAEERAEKEAKAKPEEIIEAAPEKIKAAVAKIKAAATKEAKAALKFAPPAANDAEAFGEYAERMIVMLLQLNDKTNAKTKGAVPPQIGSALADCKAAIVAARK